MGMDASELRSFAKSLRRRAAGLQARADRAIRKSGLDMVADAAILAPKDTGYMASTIGVDFPGPLRAVLGPTANYSGYVEWGTSKMPARPYMHPSVDRRLPGLLKALTRTVTL